MTQADAVAVALFAALVLYVVTGGADFGGGVWDLLASGPRAERQRELVARAIGPIWEANHVWLILVIVLLFVCFPPVFVALTVALHVPLVLVLVGIVLRGSAFVFRSQETHRGPVQRRWNRTFAIASLLTPVTFGMCVGAIASGDLRADPHTGWPLRLDLVGPWTRPFPIAVGALAVALFAFLAATYLTNETEDVDLREDFRKRALASGVASVLIAALALAFARSGAPRLFERLASPPGGAMHLGAAAVFAALALGALARRRYRAARMLAPAFAAVLVIGWAWAQFPRLIEPDLEIRAAAIPARDVLGAVLLGLAVGGAVLVPSLVYLFRVFKGNRSLREPRRGTGTVGR